MSEEKLKLSQKVFALVERLIRETKVRDLDLGIKASMNRLDFTLGTTVAGLPFAIPVKVGTAPVTFDTTAVEILHQLTHPAVEDVSFTAMTTRVYNEEVETINTAAVREESLHMTTTAVVVDWFKQHKIQPGRLSSSFPSGTAGPGSTAPQVKSIDLGFFKPKQRLPVHTLPDTKLKITPQVKENLFFFKRLTVHKKSAVLTFLPEREQLVYWKKAIIQTRKEARQLEMIGVYPGVPYGCIENIKVNYSERSLNYNFKLRSAGSRDELKDIALFNDMTANKILIVVK